MPAAEIVVALADELFAAIERGDEARLVELFDDDKQRALRVLRWFIGITAERSYEILDRQLFPDGFVQQHVLHATGTNGGSIALRVCIVIKSSVSSGSQALIRRIDEYFDPAELAPIMS